MDPSFLAPLIPISAILAFAAVKITKVLAGARRAALPDEAAARLEALEHKVDGLQQELGETLERLDFAERMLSQAREPRRLGE
jgi:hypothetical protein